MAIETATGPNGEKVYFNGKDWVPYEESATGPDGQKAIKVGGSWVYDTPTAPEPPVVEPMNWYEKFGAAMSGPAAGSGMALIAANKPVEEAYRRKEADSTYNIGTAGITQAESDALPEASHAQGDFAGDIGTGLSRSFLYDEDTAAILAARTGGEALRDGAGNLIVKYPDGSMERINKDKFSATDALQIPGEISSYLGLGAVAKRSAKRIGREVAQDVIEGYAKKTLKEGAKGAGYSAAKDVVGNVASGSADALDIDLGRVGSEAAFAAGGQALLDPLVSRASVGNAMTGIQGSANRAVREAGEDIAGPLREAMETTKIDPKQAWTPDQVQAMNNYYMANPYLDPDALARGALAVANDTVPTNAVVSGDPGRMMQESNVMKAGEKYRPTPTAEVTGETYRDTIQGPRARRTQQVIDDVDRPADLGDVQESIAGARDEVADQWDQSFKNSRAEGMGQVSINANKINEMNANITKRVRKVKGLSEIDLPPITTSRTLPDGTPLEANLGDLFAYRDTISGLNLPSQKKRAAIEALEDEIQTFVEDGMWESQTKGVWGIMDGRQADMADEWQQGLDTMRESRKKWDSQKFVTRAVEKAPDGTFIHDGEQIADNLFGGINGGLLGKSEARRAVRDLQEELPEETFDQVKRELRYRIMGLNRYDDSIGQMKGTRTAVDRFDKFLETDPELAEMIFDGPEGVAQANNFMRQIETEYADPRLGAANTSNTDVSRIGRLGGAMAERGGSVRAIGNALNLWSNPGGQIQRSVRKDVLPGQSGGFFSDIPDGVYQNKELWSMPEAYRGDYGILGLLANDNK